MPITAQYAPITSPSAGDAAPVPITWPFSAPNDIVVHERTTATGVELLTASGIDYTVTMTPAGGTINPLRLRPVGTSWIVSRSTAVTQPSSLRNGGPYNPETIENVLNRTTLQVQELREDVPTFPARRNRTAGAPLAFNGAGEVVIGSAIGSGDLSLRGDLSSAVVGKGAGLLAWPVGTAVNQPQNAQHFTQNGATINRLGRTFFGAAGVNDGAFPNVVRDWFTDFQLGTGIGAGSLVSSVTGAISGADSNAAIPFLSASRSLNFTAAGTTAIGFMGVAVNNNATLPTQAYGGYFEGHAVTAAVGPTYGVEIDIRAMVNQQGANPFQQGSSHNLQLASGAGVGGGSITASIAGTTLTVTAVSLLEGYTLAVGTKIYGAGISPTTSISALGTGTGGAGTYTLNNAHTMASQQLVATNQFRPSAQIYLTENPIPTLSGIVFGARSIDGCDGVSGVAECIGMARGHYLRWYAAGGVGTSLLYSTATTTAGSVQLDMGEGQLAINNGLTGSRQFEVGNLSAAVNFLRAQPAIAAGAVALQALGTDANIDLRLTTKGTGVVRFGTFTGSADVVCSGSFLMRTDDGVLRKVMITA